MADNDLWPPFGIGVVIAAGVIGGIVAVGWAAAQIIPAVGVAAGLASALTVSGLAAAPGVAAWWGPTAAIGLGTGGAAAVYLVLVKATREAPKEPYKWTLPLLGIAGSLLLDLAKDYAIDNQLLKILLTAILAFFVVVAGACFESKQLLWRLVAVMMLLLPPAALLLRNLTVTGLADIRAATAAVPTPVWLRLGGFLAVALAVIVLQRLDARSERHLAGYHP